MLRSIHDVNQNQWNNLVVQTDRGTMFHRYEWLAAFEEGLECDPRHALVQKDTNPVAILPTFSVPLELPHDTAESIAALDLRLLTSGDPGSGGPVIATDERANVDRLVDAIESTTGPLNLCHQIVTHDLGEIRYGKYLQARGYEPTSHVALSLADLDDGWEAIHDRMDKERQKGLRRAHEQDYWIERQPLGTDLDRTYEMCRQNIVRVGGDPLPRALFEALSDRFADRVQVFTAHVDGDVVGKYVHLCDEESSVLHHWLSAIPDEDCYDAYPSELLHERAINWGIESGLAEYNFHKVGSYFDNSVFRFKSKYGGRAVPQLRWEKGANPLLWHPFRFGRSKHWARAL